MNAVEIEEAISELAARPFDADEFPYAFLAAFGNKETTLILLARNAFPGDHCGYLRPGNDAGQPATRPRTQRRGA